MKFPSRNLKFKTLYQQFLLEIRHSTSHQVKRDWLEKITIKRVEIRIYLRLSAKVVAKNKEKIKEICILIPFQTFVMSMVDVNGLWFESWTFYIPIYERLCFHSCPQFEWQNGAKSDIYADTMQYLSGLVISKFNHIILYSKCFYLMHFQMHYQEDSDEINFKLLSFIIIFKDNCYVLISFTDTISSRVFSELVGGINKRVFASCFW